MGRIYEDVKALKNVTFTSAEKEHSLNKANEKYKEMISTGKVEKRGNNLLTLNEQLVNIKLKYSI